ncbi:MAG: GEVED domain-containing protein [Planctomycetota bacterium]
MSLRSRPIISSRRSFLHSSRINAARRHLAVEALQRRELLAADVIADDPAHAVAPSLFLPPTQAFEATHYSTPGLAQWNSAIEPLSSPDATPAAGSDDGDDDGSGDVGFSQPTLDEAFFLNSNPGADLTIMLDFDGFITEGTSWNTRAGLDSFVDRPYNRSGSPDSFTNSELTEIIRIWQAVAEDFAPFNVNVTTEEPGTEALRRSGSDDDQYGIRVVQTARNVTCSGCGGIAYIGSFNWNSDTPSFSFNPGTRFAPSTITHEAGHALFLAHDGRLPSTEYYTGHGSGDTAWGPLMGAGWRNVEQFDNGTYYNHRNANENYGRGNDDLLVIQDANGIEYREDDHSDEISIGGVPAQTPLIVTDDVNVSGFGIIETGDDRDFFRFETGAGQINLNIDPFNDRPNLDIWAGIYDDTGTLVAQSNPLGDLTAEFVDLDLAAGTYSLRVEGVSSHAVYDPITDTVSDPENPPWTLENPVGYPDYGSLGQYWIRGTIVDPSSDQFSIEAVNGQQVEADAGSSTTYDFTITRSGDTSVESTVSYRMAGVDPDEQGGNYRSQADAADFVGNVAPMGSVTFGVDQLTATVSIAVAGDAIVEADEFFAIEIQSETAGWTTENSVASATIINDESEVFFETLSTSDTYLVEAAPGQTRTYSFEMVRTGDVTAPLSVDWSVDANGALYAASPDDFEGGVFPTGTADFGPGESSVMITLNTIGDVRLEENETFFVRIGEIVSGSAVPREARAFVRGDIEDDDDAFSLPTSSTLVRFVQNVHSGNQFDHWAIDNLAIIEGSSSTPIDDFDPDVDDVQWTRLSNVEASDRFQGTDGNALVFGGPERPRLAELAPQTLLPDQALSFDVISGSGSNGGNATEQGEDLTLQYSVDGAQTWNTWQNFGWDTNKTWTRYDLDIPQQAVSAVAVVNEGNLSAVTHETVVLRTGDLDQVSNVAWEVVPSGANPVSPDDFVGGVLPSGTLEFLADAESASLTFQVAGDLDVEGVEGFEIRLIDDGTEDLFVTSLIGQINEVEPDGIDYGSAPQSYGTLISDNGAGHLLLGGFLGASRSADDDGDPGNPAADDDGVTFAATTYVGSTVDVSVVTSQAGLLSAWVDWDSSGTFDPGERVLDDVSVQGGTNDLQIDVPGDASEGQTYARFRFSSAGGLGPLGLAEDGEVEDYPWVIEDAVQVDGEVIIGDGSPQRSVIRSLQVDFAGPVEMVDGATDAFVITERVTGDQVNVDVTLTTIDQITTAKLDVLAGPFAEAMGSSAFGLAAGDFILTIDYTKLRVAGSNAAGQGNYVFGDERSDDFFRVLGDSTGDGTTNLFDFADFRADFGTAVDIGHRFDFDANGTVDLLDFAEFRRGFGTQRADW